MSNVLTFTDKGIYCPAGDFYIDPWGRVERALITHGHSDHARWGMGSYLATKAAAPVMQHRLGDVSIDTVNYAETVQIGDARVSFHPAGHVPGSAQIRVEVAGEVWVASGDYKTTNDGFSEPFEPVRCHAFITESTFGLPIFKWQPQQVVADQINTWWTANRAEGKASILGAYALGKAQRLMSCVDASIGPILTHASIENTNDILRAQGLHLPDTVRVTAETDLKKYPGALVICPPSAFGPWSKKFGPQSQAFASGWMALRGVKRRRAAERGFIISDHADWTELNSAIAETGAERIFVTHGYTSVFTKWLRDQGYDAHVVSTDYGGDEADDSDAPQQDTQDAGAAV